MAMIPIKESKLITIGIFVKAGSRNETSVNSGVAHFLEHMMFKGTNNRTSEELFKELDTMGTIYNAATTTQYTYYYVYGNSADTKEILDIILDIYINPKFSTVEMHKEQKVIIEEMRMRSDSPSNKLYTQMHRKIFAGTSLAREVIGTYDTVMNFRKNDLAEFRTELYKPDNTVLVIAGNFSPKPIYDLVKKILGPLKNSPKSPLTYFDEKDTIITNMKNQLEPYISIKQNNMLQQVYLMMVFPMYDLYSYLYNEIDLLAQLLSGGSSSRLDHALREKNGITYTSASSPLVYSDCGLFVIKMILNPEKLVDGLTILLKELKKTKTSLMTHEEHTKIINIMKNDLLYSLIRPMDLMTYFGINLLYNREFKHDIDSDADNLKNITGEQIKKVAKKIFVRDKINLFLYGNVNTTNYDFLDL